MARVGPARRTSENHQRGDLVVPDPGWSGVRLLLAVAVAGYLAVSLLPFRLDLPHRVDNGATRQGEGIAFVTPGMVTLPDQVASTVIDADTVRIELVVESSRTEQGNPARILTLSSGVHSQSLMIGQSGPHLVVRIRRPGTDETGMPWIKVARMFETPGPHRIVVATGPEQDTVEVDGERIATEPSDGTDRWDPAHRFMLGNEHGGTRPWLGRIGMATVTTPDRTVDLLTVGDLPNGYWIVPDRWHTDPPWYRIGNKGPVGLLHGFALVAIGLLGMRVAHTRRPSVVVAKCWSLSAATLVAKFAIAGRHPKLFDLGVELAGAVVGVGIGHLLVLRGQRTGQREPERTH